MVRSNHLKMCVLTKTVMLLLCLLETTGAARTIEGEQWLKKNNKDNKIVAMQSLQRAPVTPSQKNPCSTVPGRSKGHCALGQMNVAGHVVAQLALYYAPPPFPDNTLAKFGAALAPSNNFINSDDDDTPK